MAGKVRVHEMARELGRSSKDIISKLNEFGEFVKSASSTLEPNVVRKLRDAFPPAADAVPPRHSMQTNQDDTKSLSVVNRPTTTHKDITIARLPNKVGQAIEQSQAFEDSVRSIYQANSRKFESARTRLHEAVGELLDDLIERSDRVRFRVEPGRIKSVNSLLAKAGREKYKSQITKADQVFELIDDVIGTRITCNTVADVNRALRLIGDYCGSTVEARTMTVVTGSSKDLISSPKPSGYRAVHVNVEIEVPNGRHNESVTCEIQIRTLLQHAWGELTHEDSYKPGLVPPGIINVLSKRLANSLAVMDEIAQDIRDELERVAAEVANDSDRNGETSPALVASGDEDATREGFIHSHQVGQVLFGTVVHVKDDYALVQLNTGYTGILHARNFRVAGLGVIDVNDYVTIGETVRVEILEAEWADRPRIRFRLANPSA